MLKQLMIFCTDPYLTPLKSDQPPIARPPTPVKEESKSEEEADPSKNLASSDSEPEHGLTDDSDSDDEVQKLRRQKKRELKIAKQHERQKRSQQKAQPRKKPIGVVLVKDRTVMDIKLEEKANKWHETFSVSYTHLTLPTILLV